MKSYRLVGRVVDNRKRATMGEYSPQVGGDVNVRTTFDGHVGDYIFDKSLNVDDARGINGDRVESSCQVVDGCRVGKSMKTL